MSNPKLTFQQRSLVQQGYEDYTPEQLRQLEMGLRFTPTACSLMTLTGLMLQSPKLLMVVSFLGIWAFLAPGAHPMDLLYNHVVRHFIGAVKLPPNPFQRRLACLAAGFMNAAAATLFFAGQPQVAAGVIGVLLVLQAIVIFTHFCTLSWMYEGLMKMVGRWNLPVDPETARKLMGQGALLVDVREPNEFARGHLQGATNVPLGQLQSRLEMFQGRPCLLYCASGMRSQLGTKTLQGCGLTEVHNLGGLHRAEKIIN